MKIVEFFIAYWYIILAIIALLIGIGIAVYRFLKLPTEEQKQAVKEWLLWKVTEAEKELGSGTGQLKLRMVYDAFVARFGWLAKLIDFNTFSEWVDDALDEMRNMLSKNEAAAAYVEGDAVKAMSKVGF